MTIIYFVIALGILVLVHEWGHFIVARLSGIRVEKFSIGFGPKLCSFQRGDTEYRISILPLGGYVKLYGEDPVADADGDADKAQEIAGASDSFSNKPLRHRLATVFAGPAMNLVLCLFIMPVVFIVGRTVPAILEKPPVVLGVKADSPAFDAGFKEGDRILKVDGRSVERWGDVLNWIILHPHDKGVFAIERAGRAQEIVIQTIPSPYIDQEMGYTGLEPQFFFGNDPIVGEVSPKSPAEKAGLKSQDVIVSLNSVPVGSWTEMTHVIRNSEGKNLRVVYRRDGKRAAVNLKPMYHDGAQTWIMGITKYVNPEHTVLKRYPFFQAVKEGMKENYKLLTLTADVLGRLFTFQLSYKALGGPVQIAQATGAAARSGIGEFLYFLAFLSMQLGILNLLPIPVLDGGHVLFMAIEGIRRKPVSLKVRNSLTQAGLVLLLGLMVIITVNDVDRIWNLSEMWGKVTGLF